MNASNRKSTDCPAQTEQSPASNPAGVDRYTVALNAALLILETVDTSPPSNSPTRLANVIGICLDAIYEAERGQQP